MKVRERFDIPKRDSSLKIINFLIQITKEKNLLGISSLMYSVEVENKSGHSYEMLE